MPEINSDQNCSFTVDLYFTVLSLAVVVNVNIFTACEILLVNLVEKEHFEKIF